MTPELINQLSLPTLVLQLGNKDTEEGTQGSSFRTLGLEINVMATAEALFPLL